MGCNVPNWIKSTTTDLQVCNKVELIIIFAQKSGKGNRASRLSFTAKQNMFIASKSWKPLRNQGTLAHSISVHHCVIKAPPRDAPRTRPTVCSQGQTQVTGDSMTTGLGPWPRVGQTWISIWISRITSSLSARPQRGNSTSFLDLYFANLWSDCQKEGPWKMVQPLSDTPTPQRSSHLGSQLVDQLQTI